MKVKKQGDNLTIIEFDGFKFIIRKVGYGQLAISTPLDQLVLYPDQQNEIRVTAANKLGGG